MWFLFFSVLYDTTMLDDHVFYHIRIDNVCD